ncbi:uncharacterized protein CIMG_11622 [Coccidioides immitis RS]|uniref:Uncharacterized protein n=1 Tax=Coccidioides immitis (strain RS) TaxID=246410 RepID=A0A0D8JU33_COCIM|nr:uncharacterized protein CIMG_11622 [Coccidioides immitis RS]KJF60476.1 hypothetical protein CIMG_11622 [Coccidioides immitis RS]
MFRLTDKAEKDDDGPTTGAINLIVQIPLTGGGGQYIAADMLDGDVLPLLYLTGVSFEWAVGRSSQLGLEFWMVPCETGTMVVHVGREQPCWICGSRDVSIIDVLDSSGVTKLAKEAKKCRCFVM